MALNRGRLIGGYIKSAIWWSASSKSSNAFAELLPDMTSWTLLFSPSLPSLFCWFSTPSLLFQTTPNPYFYGWWMYFRSTGRLSYSPPFRKTLFIFFLSAIWGAYHFVGDVDMARWSAAVWRWSERHNNVLTSAYSKSKPHFEAVDKDSKEEADAWFPSICRVR